MSKRKRENEKIFSTSDSSSALVPVSLGKPSLRRRLEDYYSLIAPDVISDDIEWRKKFELIYDKYGGTVESERNLAKKLAKKYGDSVKLLIAGDEVKSKIERPALRTMIKQNVHSEDWYELSSAQRNSHVINFTQEDFDPLAVLHTPSSEVFDVNPYARNSPLLDNIDKFRFLLPECDPLRKENIVRSQKKSSQVSTCHSVSLTEHMRNKIPVFTAMAANYEKSGPLSLLHSIHVKRQRVRVTIRYVDCIRGTLTGYLIAFDKHMNMLLRDVDEVYTSRITKIPEAEWMTKSELEYQRRQSIKKYIANDDMNLHCNANPRVKVVKRHMPQILVRGDNVVAVWRADAEKPN